MITADVTVAAATDADVVGINRIYNAYVVGSHISFDTEPWTREQRSRWLADRTREGHPVLVARRCGEIVGSAWSGPWRAKNAYSTSVETTVVIEPGSVGMRIGSVLYGQLIDLLAARGFHRCYGVVALPNEQSVALHHKLGFTDVGVLDEVGYKDGSFVSTLLLELKL